MLLFSRQKRLQRDRDAGLVFCWRGGMNGNRGGFVLSILIASAMFALAFWGINLEFKRSIPESRDAAKILLLDTYSPEMALWVDQHSPFPSRWDPQMDSDHLARVDDELEVTYQQLRELRIPWHALPKIPEQLTPLRLVDRGRVELGNLPKAERLTTQRGITELVMTLRALGGLKDREPETISPFSMPIPRQSYGSDLRFVVTLSADGKITQVVPAEWIEGEYARNVANWLRTQRFKPSSTPLQIGEVSVRVEGGKHAAN